MRILLFLCALALAIAGAVAALNWPAVTAMSPVSLGFMHVDASISAILLGSSLVAVASLAIYIAVQGAAHARATRAHAKALQAQRALAEQAEASRFTELRLALSSEFERFSATLASSQQALRQEIQDSGNSLAAMLAEIDDRARGAPGGPPTLRP